MTVNPNGGNASIHQGRLQTKTPFVARANREKASPKMAMQTTANLQKRNLQVQLENGTSANGTTKTTTRTFSNISSEATAEAMNHTATQIASLLDETSTGVYYTDKYLLIEVEEEA